MKEKNLADLRDIAAQIYSGNNIEHMVRLKYKDGEKTFDQALPDSIGLKQHSAECSSDSIQELFLFADEIREYTQPIMYNITKEQTELRVRLALDSEDWVSFQEYFYYIQKRFKAHYDVLNYVRKHNIDAQRYYNDYENVCHLNPLFKRKEATSLVAGVLALKRYKKEDTYSGTGLIFAQAENIVSNLLKCLGVPFKSITGIKLDGLGVIVQLVGKKVMVDGTVKKKSLGHVVSFMKVLDQWVYYDNNRGFIVVDVSVLEALRSGKLNIVYYDKVNFVKTDDSDKFISVWTGEEKWDTAAAESFYNEGKLKSGIYYYEPSKMLSVIADKQKAKVVDKCPIENKKAKNAVDLLETMANFRACIYGSLHSNSGIFEQMFRYVHDSIALVKTVPEVLEFVIQTSMRVVLRPACSPMTHYWCHKIHLLLNDIRPLSLTKFKIPKLRSLKIHTQVETPPELIEKRREALLKAQKEREMAKTPTLTPCLPGQVRDAKTKKCRDRLKRAPNEDGSNVVGSKNDKRRTAKSKCPKGMTRDPKTGECVDRLPKCPPGQVRDRKTKLCRNRLEKDPCPEGQIRDPKTKLCRDAVVYKF